MIVLYGWEKGGVGKTNTAVQMSAMLSLAGEDVILVDGDKQGSASNWAEIRSAGGSTPIPCSSRQGRSCATDSVLYSQKYAHVVIDAGGRDSSELRYSMTIADLVVMPVRPGQYDAWAVDNMVYLKREVEEKIGRAVRVALLINAANPSSSEAKEAQDYLREGYGDVFELFNTVVYDRVVHRRSAREGLSVVEMTKSFADAKAVSEIKALYAEIYGRPWEKCVI
jgi:chromosome partitioning protein